MQTLLKSAQKCSALLLRCRHSCGRSLVRWRIDAGSGTRPSGACDGGSSGLQRLTSPVTWGSAAVTLGVLYGLYQYQYNGQIAAQRVAGKPDLGGDFSLVDLAGKRVTSASIRGQWTLLYFGFTHCPDICPDELNKLTAVLENLERRGQIVHPVFITIDPSRDTTKRLAKYFAVSGFHPRFLPLTGSFDEVKKACRAYRVYFTKPTAEEIARGDYLLDHSIISYLVDPDGHFADYYGKSLSAAEMEVKSSQLIADWERQRWWDVHLPTWLGSINREAELRRKLRGAEAKK